MRTDRVDDMLNTYREYVGRCGHLETAIELMELQITLAKTESIEEMALKTNPYGEHIRGSGISDPTSRIGIAIAENDYPIYIHEMESQVREMQDELKQKQIVILFVDAWLKGLPEREQWLIKQQMIDKVSWRQVCYLYAKQYGEEYSKEGLRRIRSVALQKIYEFAQ